MNKLLSSDQAYLEFFGYKDKKKYDNFTFLIIFLFPFGSEIINLIVCTFGPLLNYSGKSIVNKDQNTNLFLFKLAWKLISSFLIITYLLFVNKKKIFADAAFVFCIAQILMPICSHGLHVLATKEYISEDVNNFLRMLCHITSWCTILVYVLINPAIANSCKRFFYSGGSFIENGQYLLPRNCFVDKEKALFCYKRIFFYTFTALFWAIFVAFLIEKITKQGHTTNNQEKIVDAFKANPIDIFVTTVIVYPIYEELLYRHMIMKNNNTYLSISISSFTFALAHVRNEGIDILLKYLVPAVIFSYVYWKYRNILFTIGIHSLFNLVVFMQMIFQNN